METAAPKHIEILMPESLHACAAPDLRSTANASSPMASLQIQLHFICERFRYARDTPSVARSLSKIQVSSIILISFNLLYPLFKRPVHLIEVLLRLVQQAFGKRYY